MTRVPSSHSPAARAADFVMVVMPWAQIDQPSLQAGLLCARLKAAGLDAATWYANLDFARAIGWSRYEEFCSFHNFCADWPFSEPLFGDFPPPSGGSFLEFAASSGIGPAQRERLITLKDAVAAELVCGLERVDWANVKVAGFTTTMLQPLPALAFAKLLSERFPHLRILFGGAGCHGEMGAAMHRNFPFIDGVVDGEADATIVPLLRRLLEGDDPRDIPGLIWRARDGTVQSTPVSPIADLASYPDPDYSDFFAQSAEKENPRLRNLRIPFEASRGCWWATRHHCRFCGLNQTVLRQRERPLAAVVEEIRRQRKRHGPATFIAADNIISQRHLRDLPAAMAAEGPVPLFFEVGAAMSRRHLAGLAASGATDVQPGIESLSTDVLRTVDKGTTALLNVCFLRRAEEFGVRAHWNLLYGFPGEDPAWYDDMLAWMPAIHHLPPPDVVRFSLQRFSPYFDNPEAFGIEILGPLPATRYIWDLPESEILALSYDVDFRFPSQAGVARTGTVLREAADEWRRRCGPLTVEWRGTGAEIRDRRNAGDRRFMLDPGEAALLSAAEAPVAPERIFAKLRTTQQSIYLKSGGSVGLMRSANRLAEAGLLLSRDDRLLALPVPVGDFWTW